MEMAATTVVRMIGEDTGAEIEEASCVLVRCFVTLDRRRLPDRLATMVGSGTDADPDDQFLVLLATEGIEPEWCDRRRSRHHQVIPLAGTAMSVTFPMVTRMFRQFGCPLPARPLQGGAFVDPAEHAFGVFHVEEATDSSAIPNQDFISKYQVASVVGLGGSLPTGDVFAVLIFSREPIDRHAARLVQPWALSIKLAFLPVFECVFAEEVATEQPRPSTDGWPSAELSTLRTLLDLQEALLVDEDLRLRVPAGAEPDADLSFSDGEAWRLQ